MISLQNAAGRRSQRQAMSIVETEAVAATTSMLTSLVCLTIWTDVGEGKPLWSLEGELSVFSGYAIAMEFREPAAVVPTVEVNR
jgi:hypothetical protein